MKISDEWKSIFQNALKIASIATGSGPTPDPSAVAADEGLKNTFQKQLSDAKYADFANIGNKKLGFPMIDPKNIDMASMRNHVPNWDQIGGDSQNLGERFGLKIQPNIWGTGPDIKVDPATGQAPNLTFPGKDAPPLDLSTRETTASKTVSPINEQVKSLSQKMTDAGFGGNVSLIQKTLLERGFSPDEIVTLMTNHRGRR